MTEQPQDDVQPRTVTPEIEPDDADVLGPDDDNTPEEDQ